MSTVAIVGASGVAGLELLRQTPSAFNVVGVSRRPRATQDANEWATADIETGAGLADALQGCDTVIHLATDPKRSRYVDVEGTRKLVQAAKAAGVQHLLYLSITGCDRVPFAYYEAKTEAEGIIRGGGVPYTILRATQFHEFNDSIFRRLAATPVLMPLPRAVKTQTVALSEVADHIWRRITVGPTQKIVDFVGPDIRTWGEMLPPWRAARGVTKRLLPLPIVGKTLRAFAAGAHTEAEAPCGRITWEEWLAAERADAYAGR
jgi:uncharacterized protein YbjT (DUF2867 family)